jgi:hypothetical protein
MSRKRKLEHGAIIGGRLQLDTETRVIVRTYTRIKYKQACLELTRCELAHKRMGTQQSLGALKRAEYIHEHYETLYSAGQHGVDPVEWAEAWAHVTTVERHLIDPKQVQRTIPGMD